MNARIMLFDTETTGLDFDRCAVISFSATILDATLTQTVRSTTIYAQPFVGADVVPEAVKINGYNPELWTTRGAIQGEDLAAAILDFIGTKDQNGVRLMMAGHNVSFDIDMLKATMRRSGKLKEFSAAVDFRSLDTVTLTMLFDLVMQGSLQSTPYKLTTLTERFGVPHGNAHDAESDRDACGNLIGKLVGLLRDKAGVDPTKWTPPTQAKSASARGSFFVQNQDKHLVLQANPRGRKGKLLVDVHKEEPDFIVWVLRNISDLSEYDKAYCKALYQGKLTEEWVKENAK